ncbi:MAG: hypothetical protein Q4G19_00685 [Clostridia bacterium]|nr:hypothetical protein [Clostridia bacterium]
MKRRSVIILMIMLLAAVALLSGCAHTHQWKEATCTAPQTCLDCGETKGDPAPHIWADATCTAPKTCGVCGAVEGEPLGHSFTDATCTEPKTCTVCGAVEGEPLGHSFTDATCTEPKTCTVCGAVEGEPLGHSFTDATCAEPGVCTVCGAIGSEPLGHEYGKATPAHPATCIRCAETTGEKAGLAEMLRSGAKVKINHVFSDLFDLIAERQAVIRDDKTRSDIITVTDGGKTLTEFRFGKEENNGFQTVISVPETSETIRLRLSGDTFWFGTQDMLFSMKAADFSTLFSSLYIPRDAHGEALQPDELLADLTDLINWLGNADISDNENTFDLNISLDPSARMDDIIALITKYAAKFSYTSENEISSYLKQLKNSYIMGNLHFSLDKQSRCKDWHLNGSLSSNGETLTVTLSCQNGIISGSLNDQYSSYSQTVIPIDGYMGEKQFSLNIQDSSSNKLIFALQAGWAGHFNLSCSLPASQFSLFMTGKDENGRAELTGTVADGYNAPVQVVLGMDYTYDEANDLLILTPDYSAKGSSSYRGGVQDGEVMNAGGITMTFSGMTMSLLKGETTETGFEYILEDTTGSLGLYGKRLVFSFEKTENGFTLTVLNRTGETAENDETVCTITETASDAEAEPFDTTNAIEITPDMLMMFLPMITN